jgi:DNA repair protein RecN (Recombination protein N)
MLEELHVRDLALIEDVWLEFGPGLTALTGETGTGKTALVGALKLLLGERADASAVRAGASEALIEGRFALDGEELMVRRRVTSDGRSRCTVDGEMATVGALAEKIGPLVDLHGQHEHQALLHPATHAGYLDAFAGDDAADALAHYRSAREAYRRAERELEALEAAGRDAATNADYLRFVADEIGRVDPRPGEDAEIEAQLPALQHAEKLADAAAEAVAHVRGEGAASDRLAMAHAALGRVAGIDPALDELSERLAGLSALADDLGGDLRAYRDSVEHDPAVLDGLLARLGELTGLTRKYGPRLDEVISARESALAALASADAGEEGLAAARASVEAARGALEDAAARLDAVRREAAPRFTSALAQTVADLAMPHARFEVSFGALPFEQWSADGPSRLEFLYAPQSSTVARPLARIASGGELSRVMLALKSCLSGADTARTLVFDEIDSGIGGAAAHAIGRRLAELARSHQVIVVTHLAQVAAYADAQVVVSRDVTAGSASTAVEQVTGEARVSEIARMLSGNDSEASVAHARELLGLGGSPA